VNATGNAADDKSILTAVHGSGEMTLGEGASTITAKTNMVEIVPTSGNANLTVKGTASDSNCTLRLIESQTNQGFQIVANGGEDGLNIIREDNGSTDTLLALRADGQRIQQYFSDDGVEHNRAGVGNLNHITKVQDSSNSVSDQIRIGTGSTEGYNTVATDTAYTIQRVNSSTATDCVSIDRATGNTTFSGLECRVKAGAQLNPLLALTEHVAFNPNLLYGAALRYDGVANKGQLCTYDGASSSASPSHVAMEFAREGNAITIPQGSITVGPVNAAVTALNKINFLAASNATTIPIRLFDNSGGAVRIGGSTSTVQVNNLDVQGTASFANTVTAYLPIGTAYDLQSIKNAAVSGFVGSTTAFTTLMASGFPQVTVTNVQVGDRLVLTGQFVEHHSSGASGAYNSIGCLYRLVARRGSSIGDLLYEIPAAHALAATGGDNATEFANVTWPPSTYEIKAEDVAVSTTVWVGWMIKRRTTLAITLVAEADQGSTVFVTHQRRVVVPTA